MKSKQVGSQSEDNEFARMLEENLAGIKNLTGGSHLLAKVTNNQDAEFVHVMTENGAGIIERQELLDADGNIQVNLGEKLDVFYVGAQNGEKVFTTRPSGQVKAAVLQTAHTEGIPLTGRITRKIKGGYEVQLGDVGAFCPASQLEDNLGNPGTILPFLVIEQSPRKVVVSHRSYRDILRERQKDVLQGTLQVDDIITGKVVSLQDFGAFVDLGGIEALIPLSELAFERVKHPSELMNVGDEVRAKVIAIDWKEDRITLSRKPLLNNPWQGSLPFEQGQIVEGTVESIKTFGVFVRLSGNFTGLIPLSESNVPRGAKPEDYFRRKETLRVMIQNIDRQRERISLSVRRVAEADTRKEYEHYMHKNQPESGGEQISSFGKQLLASL
ncbi:MAG: S1 RNA-binding domain-containing protein, partial [Leptospiraceae bacterium]|nr:S1 RNA-binding domain-containing protein [Leptospiraceae bacterium]